MRGGEEHLVGDHARTAGDDAEPDASGERAREGALPFYARRLSPRDGVMMEASMDIDECLAGTCKSKDYVAGARAPGLPWISSTARAGAGMTLRDNMTQLWQTILDMKEAIHGYIEQNPADD